MASTDTTAGSGRPVPPRQSAEPPERPRRRWPYILLAFVLILTIPLAVLACLAVQDTSLSLRATGSDHSAPVEIGCPTQSSSFTDCYARTRVSVRAVVADSSGALRFCCDPEAERQSVPSISVALLGDTNARWSNADDETGASRTVADGEDAITRFRLLQSPTSTSIDVVLSGPSRPSLPLFGGFVSEQTAAGILGDIETVAGRLPPILASAWQRETGPARLRIVAKPVPSEPNVIGRAGDREIMMISATTEVTRSLLFSDEVEQSGELKNLGTVLAKTSLPTPKQLRDRVLELTGALDTGELPAENLTRAATLIELLGGTVVSRLSRVTEETERVIEAGEQCLWLYENLRSTVSRLDAALATYVASLPSGLLTRQAGTFDHGCTDGSDTAITLELTQGWRVLGLHFPEIATALEDTDKAGVGIREDNPILTPTRPARQPGKFLLSVASATKSGARLESLQASLAETLDVRIGESIRNTGRDRNDVIRMLHRQWSHAGCWLYDTGDGAGTLTLHIEAQFPYLNHIAFRRAKNGLITGVEITGVTLREISEIKRRNSGAGCQAFLHPARMADYASWLAAEGIDARTPVDHALRLLEDGPGTAGTLKLRRP